MNRPTPKVALPVDTDQIVNLAKDAAYIAIGFGVLSFQRAQVRRQELTKAVELRLGDVGQRLAQVEATVDQTVERVAKQLPDPAGELVTQIHQAAMDVRAQVRSRLAAA